MKEFKQFQIVGHTFDPQTLKAKFSYSFDNEVNFTETIDFSNGGNLPSPQRRGTGGEVKKIDPTVIDNLLFHASIALGISYYKLFPTANINIQSGTLNDDQISFWKQFYINGLGEFFFRNNLKPFAPEFVSNGKTNENLSSIIYNVSSSRALIPLGGGKDSLVSVELIKKLELPFDTCTFGKDNPLYAQVNAVIGLPANKEGTPRLFISRNIDPLLFKMNTEGYYNGHVPISGIIAFALTVVSYIYDYKYIVMSNEKSANEGNTEVDGMVINHQRSKSLDFEKAFDKYVNRYISPDVKYFSLLRGMYEVRIAQEFSKYSQYFSTFSSCNKNFKITESKENLSSKIYHLKSNVRCGKCPKCAFVYTILRPRISDGQVLQIFGKELYADASLEPLFKELLGISGIKPFECVGTNEEMILAMYKYVTSTAYRVPRTKKLPPILNMFANEVLPHVSESDFIALEKKLTKIYAENNIPDGIELLLS